MKVDHDDSVTTCPSPVFSFYKGRRNAVRLKNPLNDWNVLVFHRDPNGLATHHLCIKPPGNLNELLRLIPHFTFTSPPYSTPFFVTPLHFLHPIWLTHSTSSSWRSPPDPLLHSLSMAATLASILFVRTLRLHPVLTPSTGLGRSG